MNAQYRIGAVGIDNRPMECERADLALIRQLVLVKQRTASSSSRGSSILKTAPPLSVASTPIMPRLALAGEKVTHQLVIGRYRQQEGVVAPG
jgi:hypothetical protein